MNKTIITGNLGNDAEIKSTDAGRKYLSFSVAVSDGKDKPTIWFSASAWSDRFVTGRVSEFMKKGTKVLIEGKYVPTVWVREGGAAEISHNILVNDVELMSSAQSQGQDPPVQPPLALAKPAPAAAPVASTDPMLTKTNEQMLKDDDLPF